MFQGKATFSTLGSPPRDNSPKVKQSMELSHVLQAALAIAIAVGGWFFQRMQECLDEHSARLLQVEIEVARQAQQAQDLVERLHRIEIKIDKLLDK